MCVLYFLLACWAAPLLSAGPSNKLEYLGQLGQLAFLLAGLHSFPCLSSTACQPFATELRCLCLCPCVWCAFSLNCPTIDSTSSLLQLCRTALHTQTFIFLVVAAPRVCLSSLLLGSHTSQAHIQVRGYLATRSSSTNHTLQPKNPNTTKLAHHEFKKEGPPEGNTKQHHWNTSGNTSDTNILRSLSSEIAVSARLV